MRGKWVKPPGDQAEPARTERLLARPFVLLRPRSADMQDAMALNVFAQASGGGFERWFPRGLRAEFRRVIRALEAEDKIYISDRKVVKLYKLICTRAFLFHGGAVQRDDLRLLCYVANKRHELAPVAAKVRALLGLDGHSP